MIVYVEENWFEDIVQLILHADSFHPSIIFDSPLKCLWHVLDLWKVVSCKVFNCQVLVCTVERERGINWAICKIKKNILQQCPLLLYNSRTNFTDSLYASEQNSSIIVQGEERKGRERRGSERKGRERKGEERNGRERKGRERRERERRQRERREIQIFTF